MSSHRPRAALLSPRKNMTQQPDDDETEGVAPTPTPTPTVPPNAVSPAPTAVSPLLPPPPPPPPLASRSQGKVEASTLETQALAAKVGAAVSACAAVATPFLKSIRG